MKNVIPNSPLAWFLAIRPKTLAGAACPVLIGCALAAWQGHFQPLPALLCAAFAVLMQIAANFINDLHDFLKGSDRADRLGPRRACAQGWVSTAAMRKAIILVVSTAFLLGLGLLPYGGWPLLLVGLASIAFAYAYTAGPYPLAYKGWGDALVIIFFGLIAVGFTCYAQTQTWQPATTIAGLATGLIIDLLLVINNYRDRDQDKISGKRTLVVLFGERFGHLHYLTLGYLATALCLAFLPLHAPWAALLPLLFLYPHTRTWQRMRTIHHGPQLNSILAQTSRNMLIFSVLFSLGLLLS